MPEHKERLNPLNDFLFRTVMGQKGDEEQLLSFINAVLQRTGKGNMTSIEIRDNTTITPEIIGDKMSILDVLAVISDGSKANVEVQVRNQHNMERRSLFYWGQEYTRDARSGDDYANLVNVIMINIVDYEIENKLGFHTSYHLREDESPEHILTDAMEIHFLDMVKFRRLPSKDMNNNTLHRWLTYLDKSTPPETVKEVIAMDGAIRKAEEKVQNISMTPQEYELYQKREAARMFYHLDLNEAEKKGVIKVATNALRQDLSVETVANITGLDIDTINSLKAKLE